MTGRRSLQTDGPFLKIWATFCLLYFFVLLESVLKDIFVSVALLLRVHGGEWAALEGEIFKAKATKPGL